MHIRAGKTYNRADIMRVDLTALCHGARVRTTARRRRRSLGHYHDQRFRNRNSRAFPECESALERKGDGEKPDLRRDRCLDFKRKISGKKGRRGGERILGKLALAATLDRDDAFDAVSRPRNRRKFAKLLPVKFLDVADLGFRRNTLSFELVARTFPRSVQARDAV